MAGVIAILCRCCGQIDGAIDFAKLQERIGSEPGVAAVAVRDTLCLPGDRAALAALAEESGADRILLAACSPYGKGGEVAAGLGATLGRAKVRLVDLREGCAWIHGGEPAAATAKAADLLRMGIGFLGLAVPSADAQVSVRPECLVVGAGPAGLAAAIGVAQAGFAVHLVERGAAGGGMLRLISRVYPTDVPADEKLRPWLTEVAVNPQITFYPQTRLTAVAGFAGDYKVRLASAAGDQTLRVGAVILAPGAGVWLPKGLYRYGELKNVLTLMELERRQRAGEAAPRRSVFIQCVGARCAERPYCATICCPASLKNATAIRRADGQAEVTILHRDIMTPGAELERYYRAALEAGVRFVRFAAERPPVVAGSGQVEAVTVFDAISGSERTIAADQVVLSTPLVAGSDNAKLAELFGLPLDDDGFFREEAPLHPLETRHEGIFLAGSARWPVAAAEAATQGRAAAMKALALLTPGRLSALALGRLPAGKFGHARIADDACSGCGNCVAVCPYDACALQRVGERFVSRANKMRCRACGSCTSVCPNGTVQLPEQNARAVGLMIRRAFASGGA